MSDDADADAENIPWYKNRTGAHPFHLARKILVCQSLSGLFVEVILSHLNRPETPLILVFITSPLFHGPMNP